MDTERPIEEDARVVLTEFTSPTVRRVAGWVLDQLKPKHWHVENIPSVDELPHSQSGLDFPAYDTPESALAGVLDHQADALAGGEYYHPWAWACDGSECFGPVE